jgi:hypothetical protein
VELNLDTPIPYTLTPKAHAVLAAPPLPRCAFGEANCACAGDSWACLGCSDAYFGTAPDDGLCPDCRAQDDQEAVTAESAKAIRHAG